MDWNRVEGNWKQMKGKIKEKWGSLTDDDLDVIAGKRDQLEGKIQERYGVAKDQIRKDVDDWMSAALVGRPTLNERGASNRPAFLFTLSSRASWSRCQHPDALL